MSYNSKYKGAEVDAALDLAKTALQSHQDISGKLDKTEAASTYLTKTDASSTYLGKTAKAASATSADSATKATQDGSGNVIATTYATKTELGNKADRSSLAAVATSGSYNDLSNKPTIPTNTNQLTNGAGFITSQAISGKQDTLVSGSNIKTINGQSVLGSGNITIEGGGDLEIPVVDHGTGDTTFVLTPNILHKWGAVTSLTFTLAVPTKTSVANYYMVQFASGTTATSLNLPDTIKWITEPNIEANKTYQISILDNLGVIGGA